jgi:hypothetical protein
VVSLLLSRSGRGRIAVHRERRLIVTAGRGRLVVPGERRLIATTRGRRLVVHRDASSDGFVLVMLETSPSVGARPTGMRRSDPYSLRSLCRDSCRIVMRKPFAILIIICALEAWGSQAEEVRLDRLLGDEFRDVKLGEPIAWRRSGFGYAYDDVDGYHLVVLIPHAGRLEAVLAWPTEDRAREIARRLAMLGPAVTTFHSRTGLTVSAYAGGAVVVSFFRTGEINSILVTRRTK